MPMQPIIPFRRGERRGAAGLTNRCGFTGVYLPVFSDIPPHTSKTMCWLLSLYDNIVPPAPPLLESLLVFQIRILHKTPI